MKVKVEVEVEESDGGVVKWRKVKCRWLKVR